VPDEVKRWRNNTLLAIQGETSARVHASWADRRVDVLFDDVRSRPAPVSGAAPAGLVALRVSAAPGGTGAGGSAGPEPSGERWQAVGRTRGDLIVAVDVPTRAAADALRGRSAWVVTRSGGPLLLRGELADVL